jgi:hypothetical protein
MSNLTSRLDKLEGVTQPKRVAVVWRHQGETDEGAYARWREAHPDRPLADKDANVLLVGWSDPQ